MISDLIYQQIDDKIDEIEQKKQQASIIILNEGLFKQMQQETLYLDMSQQSGKVRSPYALQVYRNLRVVPSQVCENVEVF